MSLILSPSALALDLDRSKRIAVVQVPKSRSASKNLVVPSRPTHNRTWSSPPASPGSWDGSMEFAGLNGQYSGPLTPPLTPTTPRKRRSSAGMSDVGQVLTLDRVNAVEAVEAVGREAETAVADGPDEERPWAELQAREYTGQYELLPGDSESGYQEYGRGVWSVVFKAMGSSTSGQSEAPATAIPTPPASPLATQSPIASLAPKCLAVKSPIRRDAHVILENEARILTYLHQTREASNYVVPFYGYASRDHSVVLDAVPLTLESYTKTAAKQARENFSTRTMFDPIMGISKWLQLCNALIDGLAFLHSKGVVHGDIKPANILLRALQTADTAVEYDPLYCDFSSSHVQEPGQAPNEVSAVTTEFTAPELLQAFSGRVEEKAFATFENDVFALGVTVLTAATGENPYASTRYHGQRTAMAREGMPLEFARRGEQASRVRVKGMVDTFVRGAVEKSKSKRWTASQWQKVMAEIGQT